MSSPAFLLSLVLCISLVCPTVSFNKAAPRTPPTDPKDIKGHALLDATGIGNVEDVSKLLGEGVNPDYANEYGETACHLAAISSKPELLKMLIAHGANCDLATSGDYRGHEHKVHRTPLHWHVHGCQLEAVQILLDSGADVNFVNEVKETALDIVTNFESDKPDCVALLKLLKDRGAMTAADRTSSSHEL
uniref:Uncharacterized protein n=1 Tax=Hemiselmis andersenii TaxID=464988 RepID=A0A6U5BX00_HEMAN|mmetsp:Transcript_4716/g.10834  ORF Transcript_4716/g.10834 Transcript_4716/m.10834 type:complete len:190 (+) Transcript_4716:182-751(+)